MRKLSFLVLLLLASIFLFGCSSDEAASIEIPDQPTPLSSSDSFEVIGKIVEFGPGTVEILYNGKLKTYSLASTETPKTYLGELVGVSQIQDELMLDDAVYKLTPIVKPDSEKRESAMGETILEISGVIETINKNNFSLQTESGLLWMETYDNQDLVAGAKMKIDYMNWGDHMMMVQCYDESLRFLFIVTEKNRSDTGHLILSGTKEDQTTLSLVLTTATVMNFSHSSLKLGDTLLVYPLTSKLNADQNLTVKRVDLIQFRTHRTITKPILN